MGKAIAKLVVLGLLVEISMIPAKAQTSIILFDSGSAMLNFRGTGTGSLTADLGNCGLTGCSLAGSAAGSISNHAASGYSLSVGGPLNLSDNGSGTFTASTSALLGSSLMVTGSGGANLFTGTLSSLTVYQSPSSANGQAQVSITAAGAGGTIPVTGTINVGANLYTIASSGGGASAPIVPEPASMILFGSGLTLLGGVLRRRKAPADQAGRNNAAPVTPPLAGLQS